MKDWYFVALLAGCLVAAGAFVGLSWLRAPTPFETVLFQIVILITGLLGSYMYGKNSAAQAARDVIRPQARSAFRRARSLRRSLNALSTRIETMQKEEYDHRLDLVHALVNELTFVSQDALDDWRDVIPDDAADIMANTDIAPDRIDDLDEDDGGSLDWRA